MTIPNMPPRNPWLTDSVYPVSHANPAATDSVAFAGPTGGGKLTRDQVTSVPVLFVSNPTVKKSGQDTVVLAPGTLGIQKVIATGDAFDLVDFLPYPGHEEQARQSDEQAIGAALAQVDAAHRANDDDALAAVPQSLAKLGFDFRTGINGVHNLIDKDGFHYCLYDGINLLKTTDDNQARGPMRVVRSVKITAQLPPATAKSVTRIIGSAMTYDGFIAVVAPGALIVLDRDLSVKDYISFGYETVDNSLVVDEKGGIYVVTTNRMIKVVWNGAKLSRDPKDGAWESRYNRMSGEKALTLGVMSRGSGTTPTLMGFGDDPDKLVVIADADERGLNAVAFWRDEIPKGFKQKPSARSRRIADQIRIDVSTLSTEPSPQVLGYDVAFLNCTYPKPVKVPRIANAFVSGVTRPAPMGIQKFTWNPDRAAFENAWTNVEIDNTDCMVPSISAATGEMYAAHKDRGNYEYVGIDWATGAIKDRWMFPDDSRAWNAFGGITAILENGDLMIGGVFALKRVHVGAGS